MAWMEVIMTIMVAEEVVAAEEVEEMVAVADKEESLSNKSISL